MEALKALAAELDPAKHGRHLQTAPNGVPTLQIQVRVVECQACRGSSARGLSVRPVHAAVHRQR
jgi:hypothetical protein